MLINEIKQHPEAAIAFVAKISMQREMERWPTDEELKTNPLYQPSSEFQNKINKLISRAKRVKTRKKILLFFKKAIVYLFALSFVLSCTLVTAQAVQDAVISTVVEWKDEFVKFVFSQDDTGDSVSLENVSINYWPDGYTQVSESHKHDTLMVEIRKNTDNKMIYVKIETVKKDTIKNLDNELSAHTKIEYKGSTLYWSVSETNINSLVFAKNSFLISINAPESLDEIIKIGENINF